MRKGGKSMSNTLLKKFKVAVELADFICYVKYIDKNTERSSEELVDDLLDLCSNKENVTRKDISQVVRMHSNHLSPSMFREEKFHICYNTMTNQFIPSDENLFDSYTTPFVIKVNPNIDKRFNKEEFTNHFADLYHDLFLIDVRYYGLEHQYYEVEAELHLIGSELVLKAEHEQYVTDLLRQYDINEIVEILGLNKALPYSGSLLVNNKALPEYLDVFSYDTSSVLEYLVESYESSNYVFINHIFLKGINFDLNSLFKPLDKPKLIVILEENKHQYFNQLQVNNQIDRIETINGNTILYISENLFREACGYYSHVLVMNDRNHLAINNLGAGYNQFQFLSKCKNERNNFIESILEKYFERKRLSSYIDNLMLYAFVLDNETINSNLNYYLVNSLKSNSSFISRFSNQSRESIQFNELKKLMNVYHLTTQLNKPIVLHEENCQLLLNDIEKMVLNLKDDEKILEFESVINDVFISFNMYTEKYAKQIEQLQQLISIKQVILSNKQDLEFILDTSVLIDEPDLFYKYFNDKSIVVHSIIKDELENYRMNNINAIRAIRNINMLRDNPKMKLKFISSGDERKVGLEYIKPLKVKALQDLMMRFTHEGKRPILISNDSHSYDLYERNKDDIIQLKHLPLLFN